MDQNEKKARAAAAALGFVPAGSFLGVGTGSTVNYLIDALGDIHSRIKGCVASSEATANRLAKCGFAVTDIAKVSEVDLYIDGADEANENFHLIKGGGGALTREKILAGAADKFICIIDDSKWVTQLGKFPLPVEIVPGAEAYVAKQFSKLRGRPVLRKNFLSDNGNPILDIHELQITDPVKMEQRFSQIEGVVTVGIFAQRPADVLLIADDDEVRQIVR